MSATRRNSIFGWEICLIHLFFLEMTFRCSFRLFFSHPCLRRRKRRKGRRRSNPTYFPLPHLSSYLGQCPHTYVAFSCGGDGDCPLVLPTRYIRKERNAADAAFHRPQSQSASAAAVAAAAYLHPIPDKSVLSTIVASRFEEKTLRNLFSLRNFRSKASETE